MTRDQCSEGEKEQGKTGIGEAMLGWVSEIKQVEAN